MWSSSQNFDNSHSDGGFLQNSQSPSSDAKKAVRRVQSLVPLLVRQINACPDKDVNLFGFPVQMTSVVGVLKNFNVQSTKVSCTVEDHTGEIKCILWLEQDDEKPALPPVKEGCYVKVFGSLRHQENEKIIMILKLFPVDDCNVITSHLLETINARLLAEAHSKDKKMEGTSHDVFSSSSHTNFGATNLGFNDIQTKVYDLLIKSGDSDRGTERSSILSHFQPNQRAQVNDALEFLIQEGHVYTTFDSEHFKATSST